MGPLYGTLNGYTIEEQELQGYAFVADGRAYTSLAKIIPDIGYDLQSLMPVGDALAWMFAKPADGAQNGFQLTGADWRRRGLGAQWRELDNLERFIYLSFPKMLRALC